MTSNQILVMHPCRPVAYRGMATDSKRLRAAQMLVLANACWALSFPTMKALTLLQQPLLPESSSWFRLD